MSVFHYTKNCQFHLSTNIVLDREATLHMQQHYFYTTARTSTRLGHLCEGYASLSCLFLFPSVEKDTWSKNRSGVCSAPRAEQTHHEQALLHRLE